MMRFDGWPTPERLQSFYSFQDPTEMLFFVLFVAGTTLALFWPLFQRLAARPAAPAQSEAPSAPASAPSAPVRDALAPLRALRDHLQIKAAACQGLSFDVRPLSLVLNEFIARLESHPRPGDVADETVEAWAVNLMALLDKGVLMAERDFLNQGERVALQKAIDALHTGTAYLAPLLHRLRAEDLDALRAATDFLVPASDQLDLPFAWTKSPRGTQGTV